MSICKANRLYKNSQWLCIFESGVREVCFFVIVVLKSPNLFTVSGFCFSIKLNFFIRILWEEKKTFVFKKMNIIHKSNLSRVAFRRLCYTLAVGLAIIFVIIIQFEAYKYVLQSPKEIVAVVNANDFSGPTLQNYLDTNEPQSLSK